MPIQDGIGFGEYTRIKLENYARIVDMHLAITHAVLRRNNARYRQKYWYIDLTAGKGRVPESELLGSPLLFLDKAGASGVDLEFQADFVEKVDKNCSELSDAVEKDRPASSWTKIAVECHHGRYEEVVPRLLGTTRRNDFGLVFVDPTGSLPDFEILGLINRLRPKMEILIYLSSTNVKRLKQYTARTLTDFLALVGKKHWLVRRPSPGDKYKWTFLLGSNGDLFTDYKKIDFYRTDSPTGQEVLEKLNLTEDEFFEKIQPRLL